MRRRVPLLVGVGLLIPVSPTAPAHRVLLMLLGAQSKTEVLRARSRALAAMRAKDPVKLRRPHVMLMSAQGNVAPLGGCVPQRRPEVFQPSMPYRW